MWSVGSWGEKGGLGPKICMYGEMTTKGLSEVVADEGIQRIKVLSLEVLVP